MPHTLVGQQDTFKIAAGQQNSNSIEAKEGNNGSVMVFGENPTDGVITYKYQCSPDNASWYDLVDAAGANVIPPLQGKCKSLNDVAPWVRIQASAVVTAERRFPTSAEI